MRILVSILAVVCFVAVTQTPVAAQETNNAGTSSGLVADVHTGEVTGAALLYMISKSVQVGAGVGMQIREGSNAFYFSPRARFLISILSYAYLFIDAQFRLLFGDASGTALVFGVGLLSWVTSYVALYGGVAVLDLGFDPSYTTLGLLSAYVGMQLMLTQ